MALSKTVILKNNFGENSTFVDAYIKVFELYGSKELMTAKIEICKAKGGQRLETTSHNFAPNLESENNFLRQAYMEIKTLPQFVNSIDC